MRKDLTLKELQCELKEMLRKISEFLGKHNIEYYVSYGTMLGTIRHKGFIPWDDDIDISMTRENFEKLVKIAKINCNIDNELQIQYCELGNSVYPIIKIVNKKIFLYDSLEIDKNIWIDVFPLDSLPNDEKEIKKFMKKTFIMSQLYMVKNFKYREIPKTTRSIRATILKYLCKPLTIFINKEKWIKKYLKIVKKYNNVESKFISGVAWHRETFNKFPKSILASDIYDFEDIKVIGFKDYDCYLKICYGDYMTLPPEDKRETHNTKAYVEVK